jgi:hypothetical protein
MTYAYGQVLAWLYGYGWNTIEQPFFTRGRQNIQATLVGDSVYFFSNFGLNFAYEHPFRYFFDGKEIGFHQQWLSLIQDAVCWSTKDNPIIEMDFERFICSKLYSLFDRHGLKFHRDCDDKIWRGPRISIKMIRREDGEGIQFVAPSFEFSILKDGCHLTLGGGIFCEKVSEEKLLEYIKPFLQ